jgi:hypothetical protein
MSVPPAAVAQPMAQQAPLMESPAQPPTIQQAVSQQPVTQPLSAPLAAAAPPSQALGSQALGSQALGSQALASQAPAVAPSEAGTTGPFTTVPAAPKPDLVSSQPNPAAAGALSKLTGAVRGRRAARKPRLAMSAIFADLVDMADIPRSAYAVDEEITGAMCLFKTDGGYEVFSCAEDARHEVRFFEEEEAAYFYLFGVLAAEALRNGRLSPRR